MAVDEPLAAVQPSACSSPYAAPLSEAPAFFVLFPVCATLYLQAYIPPLAAIAASLLLTAALILIITKEPVKGWLPLFVLILIFSAIFSAGSLYTINRKVVLPDSLKTGGRVIYSRPWGRSRALLIATSYGKFVAYVPDKSAPKEGGGVTLRGALFDFKDVDKPGGFNEGLYWRTRGAIKKIVLFEIEETDVPSGVAAYRAKLERLIGERLLPLSASYMTAFTVGGRTAPMEELHRRAGTSHLLAVSGMHVWIIAGLFLLLLRGNLTRVIVISFFLWSYLLLLGFPTGGVRAAVMVELMLVSLVIGRPVSAFNNVSAAAALLLAVNPWNFFDLGWRLSVLCALFISAAAPFMGSGIRRAVCLTVLLWFVTAPIVTRAFGEAPIAGLALNIAAVPAFGVIFPLVMILSIPPLLGLPLSNVAAESSEMILFFFQKFLKWGASIFPGAVGWEASLFALSAAIFAAVVALRCGAGVKKASFIAAIFVLFLFYCPSML